MNIRTVLVTLCFLAACSSGPQKRSEEVFAAKCDGLKGQTVPPSAIALPSRGAVVDTAQLVETSPFQPKPDGAAEPAQPRHCRVLGRLPPTDPAAPAIHYQLNLPLDWNGKLAQYGGGGLNGVLISGLAPLRDAPPGAPTPLSQGYATYGTDSGHQAADYPPTELGAWALSDEALENFAHASYKKVRDTAVALASAFYGAQPKRVYFVGGSEGGREALMMAQRYPESFDGVVSVVPVVNWVGLMLAYQPSQMLQFTGGWMAPEQVAMLGREVVAACDALDGISDGVVSDFYGCTSAFQPSKLGCTDGGDSGTHCLSDAQLRMVGAMHRPLVYAFPHANGLTEYPNWLWGAENILGGFGTWVTGAVPPAFPPTKGHSTHWTYGNNVLRYFLARDAGFDPRQFSVERFRARIEHVSALMDATQPDLSGFAQRGGKIMLRENMSDYAQSPLAGIRYYESVVNRMGRPAAEGFFRVYASSASNHTGFARSGSTGEDVPTSIDLLEVLDTWVDRGVVPPESLVQVHRAAKPPFETISSRPMCRYPGYPHYRGTGDPRRSESYECRESQP